MVPEITVHFSQFVFIFPAEVGGNNCQDVNALRQSSSMEGTVFVIDASAKCAQKFWVSQCNNRLLFLLFLLLNLYWGGGTTATICKVEFMRQLGYLLGFAMAAAAWLGLLFGFCHRLNLNAVVHYILI